ncbi:hypothetical protein ES707_02787 [subsurface metagenome]
MNLFPIITAVVMFAPALKWWIKTIRQNIDNPQ